MSDLTLTFTGTLFNPYTVFNGHVNSINGDPPPFQPNGSDLQLNTFFNPRALLINWNSPLLSGSINQVISSNLSSLPFRFTLNYLFTVTSGTQDDQDGRNEIFLLTSEGNTRLLTPFILSGTNTFQANTVYTNKPSFTFSEIVEPATSTNTLLSGVQLIAYNIGALISNQPIDGYNLQMAMSVTLQIFCMDANLETGFCANYCQAPTNLASQSCFDAYRTLCIDTNNTAGAPNIVTIPTCQTYFKEYIQQVEPRSEFDTKLITYCSKYTGINDFLNQTATNQVERDLCACHLNPTFYQNIKTSLIEQVPAYQLIAEDERCLFPECVDSPYKTVETHSQCALPQCLDIINFTNNGTITGKVTINQNAACSSVNGGGSGGGDGNGGTTPNNPTNKSWWDKYWIWIVVGAGLLIVLIIIIVIIVVSENKKKKIIYPR